MKLKIAELPKSGETITVEIWPLKAKGVRFDRDFKMSNNEKGFVMGLSEWCTLDYTTQKLHRVNSIAYPRDMQFREDRSGAGELLRAKESVCDTDFNHTYRSSFVDIDTNKYTNNVAYLRMILCCRSPGVF